VDLKHQRTVAGLSQCAVAQRSGIPRMRLSLVECGEIELKPAEVEKIRKVLRTELERRAAKLQNALSTMTSTEVSA